MTDAPDVYTPGADIVEGEADRFTLYISGPMTGIKHWNYPAFTDAAAELRAWGFNVISPHELDQDAGVDPNAEWTAAMRRDAIARDVEAVAKLADGVALLDGWHHSSGARAEVAVANSLSLPIQTIHEWIAEAREDAPAS
ncbi:deoxycytidylate deaminase [Microbacterium phage Percival]|uniref:Deoxycytidylate deaminase n=1 Tax=Microbacterium phage Percival TaxID=2201439 RepID=A0A2Z4Q899_9CAUD|nr:deoxycytidylate deaminase [Microbacterium phage Percival]